MNDPVKDYVGQRAETLAREFLTRSPDVELHRFDSGQVDYILTLRSHPISKPRGFMAFGAIVKGTERQIADEQTASRYLKSNVFDKKSKSRTPANFIPMIVIIYSVKTNIGYYAWVTKPVILEG